MGKIIKRNEFEFTNEYSDDFRRELLHFLSHHGIGLENIDFSSNEEHFAETMKSPHRKFFLLVKYQQEIAAFAYGLIPKNKDLIESMISIHRRYFDLDFFTFLINEISAVIRSCNNDKIIIQWFTHPSKIRKIESYFRKMRFNTETGENGLMIAQPQQR